MQITLPENTTHIVICTSGRGNNNEQTKDNNSNTSLTLDIKPNSSGTSLFDNVGKLQEIRGIANTKVKHINNISMNDRAHYFPSTIKVAMHLETKTKDMADDGNEQGGSNLTNTQEGCLRETSTNDEFGSDGGKKSHYNCSECGKSYSTSSNLARHRQTHR